MKYELGEPACLPEEGFKGKKERRVSADVNSRLLCSAEHYSYIHVVPSRRIFSLDPLLVCGVGVRFPIRAN